MKHRKNSGTRFSRNGYVAQIMPALMMTHALRYAFDIEGGQGQIENADESMVIPSTVRIEVGPSEIEYLNYMQKNFT